MSYCRTGVDNSDVYMYSDGVMWHVHGPDGAKEHQSLEAARDHLLEIRSTGYTVPDYALERVEREIADPINAPRQYRESFTKEITQALDQLRQHNWGTERLARSNIYSQCATCGVYRTLLRPYPLNEPVTMYIARNGRFISCGHNSLPPACHPEP